VNTGNIRTGFSRVIVTKLTGTPGTPPNESVFRLLEDDDFRILENGDFRILE